MTVKFKEFGQAFVTRYDANKVIESFCGSPTLPILDFTGVSVVNHSFADELGKGILANFAVSDLSGVAILGANRYVSNCLEAGFSTAAEA